MSLPEEVYKILNNISASNSKVFKNFLFAYIKVIEENSISSCHYLLSSSSHYSVSCNARRAASVFFRPLRCPYSRAANEVKIAIKSDLKSLVLFSAILITSILKEPPGCGDCREDVIAYSKIYWKIIPTHILQVKE